MMFEHHRFRAAVGYVLLSTLCLSIYGLFAKFTLSITSIPLLLFLRFFIPFILMLPVLLWLGTFKRIFPVQNLKNQFLRSLSTVVSQLSFFYYLTSASLLDATMLLNTGPIFIPIIAWFLHGHSVGKKTWWSIGIALIGVALIVKPTQGIFDLFSLVGLLAGIATAFSQVFYGVNVEKESQDQNLFYVYFLGTLLSVPALLAHFVIYKTNTFSLNEGAFSERGEVIIFMIALGVTSIGNQFFRGMSYRHAKPTSLAPFLYSTVVFSGLWDWFFFQRTPDYFAILGTLLILLASLLKWSFVTKNPIT
jgi:drug/metabolite transporter (DMT)-like permease